MVGTNGNTRTRVYPGSGRGAIRPADCACVLYCFAPGVPVEGGYMQGGSGEASSHLPVGHRH
jgi:hypothetical protein